MAPHRPEPDRVAGVLQHGLDRARADHVQREQRGRARGTRWAAYDPVSDRWRLLAPAPIAARLDRAAVWTGREMLVWGGRDGRRSFGEGAVYDPRADRWGPMAGRSGSSVAAAWTGTRMLVWDGSSTGGRTGGALYDPVRDRWTPITRGPALGATAPDRCGPAPSW